MKIKAIPGIKEPFSSKILALFRSLSPNTVVILFGSRAKGNFREGSDIDIALKGEGTLDAWKEDILEKYETLFLPWKLDIVVYDHIEEPEFKKHIDRVGVPIDCSHLP